jgi:hypothetical protein
MIGNTSDTGGVSVPSGFSNAGSAAGTGNTPPAKQNSGSGGGGGNWEDDPYGIYGLESAAANKAYQQALANIAWKRKSIWQQYGYDPNGSGAVDGTNLMGLYQQDRHNNALELNAAEDSANERGLIGMGTVGLGAQVADAPRFDENVRAAQMAQDYTGALHEQDMAEQQAKDALEMALLQARLDAIAAGGYGGGGGDGGDGGDGSDGGDGNNDTPTSTSTPKTKPKTNTQIMKEKNPGGAKSLAATSAAMNAKYAKQYANAYNDGRKKRG